MSISPVGNSDAYARYRQQALDLLATPGQSATQNVPTPAPSYVAPTDPNDQSSTTSFATKFKADLSALNSSQGGSHAHGAHGHHHHQSATDATASTTDPMDPTDPTNSSSDTDPFSQALDQFAEVVKSTAADV